MQADDIFSGLEDLGSLAAPSAGRRGYTTETSVDSYARLLADEASATSPRASAFAWPDADEPCIPLPELPGARPSSQEPTSSHGSQASEPRSAGGSRSSNASLLGGASGRVQPPAVTEAPQAPAVGRPSRQTKLTRPRPANAASRAAKRPVAKQRQGAGIAGPAALALATLRAKYPDEWQARPTGNFWRDRLATGEPGMYRDGAGARTRQTRGAPPFFLRAVSRYADPDDASLLALAWTRYPHALPSSREALPPTNPADEVSLSRADSSALLEDTGLDAWASDAMAWSAAPPSPKRRR